MAERDEFGAFLIGFLIGGLTGAAISLLMAPQSGEETRGYLKDRAIELSEKAQETAATARDQVGSTAQEVRTRAGDLVQQSQVVLEEQKNKFTNTGKSASDQAA